MNIKPVVFNANNPNFKKELADKAEKWFKKMETENLGIIKEAFNNTKEYNPNYKFNDINNDIFNNHITQNIQLLDMDSVSAAHLINFATKNEDKPIGLLNFASFKYPGGMFIQGSTAQEESLCHESILYNILIRFNLTYYSNNRILCSRYKDIANMYINRGLYTPNVLFIHNNEKFYCNVITVAAPNNRNFNTPKEINYKKLHSRIKFVLDIAEDNNIKTIILGAFGCGIFKQNPEEVANIFKELLIFGGYNFNNIYFAIPYGNNYKVFARVLKDCLSGIIIDET